MVDDPYTFGMVAAANALSDVFAMGGRPLVALNLVGFPSKLLPLEVLGAILQGGADKVREAGAVVGGGHTVEDTEVKYGMAVTGEVHPDRVWKNGNVRPDDVLLLTKPIGTGLINGAVKQDAASGPAVAEAQRWMATLNGIGIEHVLAEDVVAVTDITGYGLLGHAREMAEGSAARLVIEARSVPRIGGIEAFFLDRLKTRAARETRAYMKDAIRIAETIDPWTQELLFDPQTSGGLLIAVRQEGAERLRDRLREAGLERTEIIGHATRWHAGEGRVEARDA